ncbi:IS110 family transposase [Agrobacterium sp. FDAARGOS_525]|uniref:IS110 family transposase n=1 Tax=Agrobacterium sp. FDAARGOS_525 TaxID=2420311 RepID=UPI000F666DA2|nr:IS110 family transposase [Agrobacterium sp. FDAARGOS_525]RSC30618.1 IS110 family transposase [Agrobacterium sp. FDAARGOS_525]
MNENAKSSVSVYAAIELSKSTWLVAVLSPSSDRVKLRQVRGGDTEALVAMLNRTQADAAQIDGRPAEIVVCFEAGYDGFWLARFLRKRGIRTSVLDSTSFLVNRRSRRAKTDRLDAESMVRMFRSFDQGDRTVCREVRVPTPEEEDAKRLDRERLQLSAERTRHVNRIRALLNLHGIREVKALWGGDWRKWLQVVRTADDQPLGKFLAAELTREFERLELVHAHIRDLDRDLEDGLKDCTLGIPNVDKVYRIATLKGIGRLSAVLLVSKVFHRQFANRKCLASFLGLAPSPYASGAVKHDQGISKAGNRFARRLLVELAWCWLRYQPASALSQWYRSSFGAGSGRSRKIGIIALARKLAVAIWHFAEDGLVPQGASLKADAS